MNKSTVSDIILSRDEMYFYDNYTIEKLGIPGVVLMENAGQNCSKIILADLLKSKSSVGIFCGTGNNGGDGFVIARYLLEKKHSIQIYLLGNPKKMSLETAENYQKCVDLNLKITRIDSEENYESVNFSNFDLIVDSIFGIGFKGEISGWRKNLILKLNSMKSTRVAIDIPSGVEADTGHVITGFCADYTLTMAAPKYGLLCGKGRELTGNLEVIDIGIPDQLFNEIPPKGNIINKENVLYPSRNKFSHKGDYGRIGIIGGASGFTGAALMAANAALRAGAGLVTIFHPTGMEPVYASNLWEAMNYSLPELQSGLLDFERTWHKLEEMDVLLIGPGWGTSVKATDFLQKLLERWHKPLVLDADALNILSSHRNLLELLNNNTLLTPHIGEFSRLMECSISDVQTDPISKLQQFCSSFKCNVLLKSATSIYCDGKHIQFNTSGNDALSTGGSGDVLAGIISSFIGQKSSISNAAIAASFLLGYTAEKLSQLRDSRSIIPTDIIANLFKY